MKPAIPLLMAILPSLAISGESACDIGQDFSVSGVIYFYLTPPAFTAILERESSCIALALPNSVYSGADSWDGKTVRILGEALPNYGNDDGVITYSVRGRDVTAAACGKTPYILFVKEIDLAD